MEQAPWGAPAALAPRHGWVTPIFGWQQEGWLMEGAHPSPQLGSTSQTPNPLHHPHLHRGKGKKKLRIWFCICFQPFWGGYQIGFQP